MKRLLLGISGAISFLLFLVLLFVTNHMADSLLDQQMAQRWSREGDAAQISCFFSPNAQISEDSILEFEHSLGAALVEASITQESENPGARLWADAYSADGKITLNSDHGTLEADAIGIGGDFFLFHPLRLLNGAYFSGNDLMQDYCIIDEDAAWQLFGSNDIAGQIVYISGIPHIISGVIERQDGKLAQKAGLDSTVVYVSYQTLMNYGRVNGINHYEIVMPNPVRDFALTQVKEQFGADEKETEILENTSRYSLLARLKVLGAFGTRSMNGKAIIYPYWENMARGYEDIIAVLTLVMLLALLYPVLLLLIWFIIWWRHKGWTLKDVWHTLQDRRERLAENLRERRRTGRKSPKKQKRQKGKKNKLFRGKQILDTADADISPQETETVQQEEYQLETAEAGPAEEAGHRTMDSEEAKQEPGEKEEELEWL